MNAPRPHSELRRLATLAWPVVLGNLGNMGMGVVDTMMVGRLGREALASVAIANTWSFAVLVVAQGAVHGLDPHFAQAFGAGNPERAGAAMARGLALMAAASLPVIALHLAAGAGLGLLGQPVELLPLAGAYCAALTWSVPGYLAFLVLRQYLQGDGLMRPAAVVVVVANGVNVLANLALIWGAPGIPAMGAVGCAWATVGSRLFMLAALAALGWPLVRRGLPGWAGALSPARLRAAVADMVPVGLQVGLESWAFAGSTLMAGWLGATAVAAHSVVLNLSAIAFMVPLGISAAASTRVGNLLGAGAPWGRAAWTAMGLGAAVMTASATLYASFPEALVRLYTDERAVIAVGATLLPIAAAFQIFDGLQAVGFGVLRGAGDLRLPALANVLGYWVLGLPVGAWLAFEAGWGTRGIWMGLTLGLAIVAGLLLLRLRSTVRRGGFRVPEEAQ
jgi:MATE family multidrug resistance protein